VGGQWVQGDRRAPGREHGAGLDLRHGLPLRRTPGPRRRRLAQHAVCQCLRSSTPTPPAIRAPSAGQATTCGVPGTISWSHPGQRYAFADPAPGIRRTIQSPSGHDSTRSGPGTGSAGPERSRRIRRGLTPVKAIAPDAVELPDVRLVIARCSVDYVGRLTAHLPEALRLLIVKADGSVLVHSDGGSYKPLNWMSPPCWFSEKPGRWSVTNKAGETLAITITEVLSDTSVDLGVDPGLVKDGVEAHLQELLAAQIALLGEGWRLVRREYPTPIGPVDLMCRAEAGESVAVEIKRRGEIDGSNSAQGTASVGGAHVAVEVKRHAGIDAVEQLTRYLELLNRDPLLRPVTGVLAAQTIRPQARTLAEDRGIRCVVLDYDAMRGIEREDTLF
jgi:RecB family endonuclease NucS